MAQTFTKRAIVPVIPDDAYLNFVALYGPEGDSQTYVYGALILKVADGGLNTCADPAVTPWGVALEDAHNDGAVGDHNIKYFPLMPKACIYANLLTGAAADFVLTAANFGVAYDAAYSATLVGGADPGWHLDAAVSGATSAFKIISFLGDETIPASAYGNEARVGDTNARVTAMIVAEECAMASQA
jgi:hypothetical protein